MATQAPLPPGFANEDRSAGFRGYCIFLTIITIVSIVLRLWSRSLNASNGDRRRFWWDDWAAVVSVACSLILRFDYGIHAYRC